MTAAEPPRSTWGGEYALIRDATRPWDLRPCHHLGCHREDRRMPTLVSASRVQRASGHARLARRVADALGGRYSTELGIDVDARDAESSGGSWRPLCSGPASRLRSRNSPSVCSATQAWHVSARHGTYRWTTSSRSWMKAAPRVTPRRPQRGSGPCPGIIGERYDGRGRHDRPAVQHLPDTAGSAGCAARPRSRRSTHAPGTPQTPRPRPGPAPAAFVRLARLAARRYTGRRDLESGLVRLALADHRRGWAYARAGTCASCSASALSAID